MKKLLSILLALMLLVPAALAESPENIVVGPGRMYVYTENGKSLNVRSEPRTGDNVVGHVKYGGAVDVVSFLDGWAEIVWGDSLAYVQSRFLQWYEPKEKPTPTEDPNAEEKAKLRNELASEADIEPLTLQVHATRSSGWVNMRSEPSKLGKRVDSLPDGTGLKADGATTNWYRVTNPANGKAGYVHKNFVIVIPTPDPVIDTTADIGKLSVNGVFDLQCTVPDGYTIQVISAQKTRIIATLVADDAAKPQMVLTVAFDEMYAGVDRMNDMSAEDLETLKKSYTDMNEVEFSEAETGEGTKLLVAKETGEDEDFVSFLSVYKGYTVEFVLTPNPAAADQTLTDDQIQKCVNFLTGLQFIPAAGTGEG